MRAVTALELAGVTVRFGDRLALDGVDLAVAEHEVVAVLGPSGSGKSTLLRVVAGLQRPAAGTVTLAGRDLANVPPHRRGIGLMFQDGALFPQRDVAGNVAYGLSGKSPERVAELLATVGLAGAGQRKVHELSGGEQQRVALARALAPEPAVLMLDEPLGQLDRTLRERLVLELRQLFVRLGTTVLAVTHDQSEAFALADRVVVMEAGRIAQEGSPQDVWERPASAFVARFLGFNNVASAQVSGGIASLPWGSVRVVAPDGEHTVLVRPDGVRIDDGADQEAVVTARTFRGDHVTLLLQPDGDGPPIEASCRLRDAPAERTPVRFRLDPADTVVLS